MSKFQSTDYEKFAEKYYSTYNMYYRQFIISIFPSIFSPFTFLKLFVVNNDLRFIFHIIVVIILGGIFTNLESNRPEFFKKIIKYLNLIVNISFAHFIVIYHPFQNQMVENYFYNDSLNNNNFSEPFLYYIIFYLFYFTLLFIGISYIGNQIFSLVPTYSKKSSFAAESLIYKKSDAVAWAFIISSWGSLVTFFMFIVLGIFLITLLERFKASSAIIIGIPFILKYLWDFTYTLKKFRNIENELT